MFLVREVMYCRPGQVRPLVEKFLAMSKLEESRGRPKFRVMTDVTAERYWTLVAEAEVEDLEAYMNMEMSEEDAKQFEEVMKGYHDLVDWGKREIYKIEG